MLNYYITELKGWMENTIPSVMNEKYFLWTIGSIFLLGIVTKWIVVAKYGRMIKKAENMTNPKNKTLRQIKMKFESVKQVNGYVANPMLLVQRHLNQCKIGYLSLNQLNNIINWCVLLIIGIAGIISWETYQNDGKSKMAIFYIFTGCFLGFALETINKCVRVRERQTELTYVIVDFLENSALAREERNIRQADENVSEDEETSEEKEDYSEEELILNQVIGEFLQ